MKVLVFGCLLLCGLLAGMVVAEWPSLPDAPAPLAFHVAPPEMQPSPAPQPVLPPKSLVLWAAPGFDDPPVKDEPEWDDCPQLSTWTDPHVCRVWI